MALTAFNTNGQLPNTKQTLYTATAGAVINSISLVNTDASARTMNLYVKTATSRRIIPKDLSLIAGAAYLETAFIVLNVGDLIEGDASAATVVDYVISGGHY